MKIVKAGEPGVSVKLHPEEQGRIFLDQDDEGRHIRLVKGVVVRVNALSFKMGQAADHLIYGAPAEILKGNGHALLVRCNDDPTPPPPDALSALQERITAAHQKEASDAGLETPEQLSDEAETGFAERLSPAERKRLTEEQLGRESARLGFSMEEATVGDDEYTDLASKKRVRGQIERPSPNAAVTGVTPRHQ